MSQTKKHPYDQWSPDARALDVTGDKWTLLIVRDLLSGPRRFVNLQRTLPGISTEQLRSRLKAMVEDGLLTRQRYREVPPRVDYELTDRGRALVPVLKALAEWGWAWEWSAPGRGEDVDITALFRLAPAINFPAAARGIVELGVGEVFYTLALRRGHAEVEEGRPATRPDVTLLGDTDAWVDALLRGVHTLDVIGDPALGALVLEGLGASQAIAELRSAA